MKSSLSVSLVFSILSVWLLSGCAMVETISESQQAEAQSLIASLRNRNQSLLTFKGVGKIRLIQQGRPQSARMAWIGSSDGKLRTEIFDISGKPIVSAANDGQYLYFISHPKQRFYKHQTDSPSLKSLISIPVKSSDMTDLLTGRIPIREHHRAWIINNESGEVLILKRPWGSICEKVYLNPQAEPDKIEFFGMDGTLEYLVEIDRFQEIGSYRIPFEMKFSEPEGSGLQIYMSQYEADVDIDPSVFELSLPESWEISHSEPQAPDMGR